MLPDDMTPTVDRQNDDKVGLWVTDDDAEAGDKFHGFLLTPSQALGTAEELMAVAGEIVGKDEAVTIWAQTLTGGTATIAGQQHHMIVATDRDHRTIRLAFSEEALRDLSAQIHTLLTAGGTPQ